MAEGMAGIKQLALFRPRIALLTVCFIVITGWIAVAGEAALKEYSLSGSVLNLQNNPHTIFTHCFVHASVLHLVSNICFLLVASWLLGGISNVAFFSIFGVSVFTGGVCFILSSNPQQMLIGASAGVLGLLAAAIVMRFNHKARLPFLGELNFGIIAATALMLHLAFICSNSTFHTMVTHFGGIIGGTISAIALCLLKNKSASQPTSSYEQQIEYINHKATVSGFSSLTEHERKLLEEKLHN